VDIGFTGSRTGMTPAQETRLQWLLAIASISGATTFHHGDCTGADAQAHKIARKYGYRIIIHPPVSPHLRAWCIADEERPPAPYHTRDRNIVTASTYLIATPAPSSKGTWYTVNYAKTINPASHIIVISPDGTSPATTKDDDAAAYYENPENRKITGPGRRRADRTSPDE
jgi:hypothetical protein